MIKKPTEFLCPDCLKKMREYDTKRKQRYRLEIREVGKAEKGKIKINK